MVRKYNPKEIDLKIKGVYPYENKKYTGFTICWTSSIGFGEYDIYRSANDNKWYADSEHMDSNDDKEFITELMRLFIEELHIEV